MRFIYRRYCRLRLFTILILIVIILLFFTNKWFIYSPSNLNFLELNACPACFGVRLCHLFGANDVHLSGWQRFSFFNNDIFNIKNTYYGTLNNDRVIFKKMAHPSEWITFDACRDKISCVQQAKPTLTTLLPCSNATFVSKFRNAFISSTGFDIDESEISLDTTIQINLEPIVLAAFLAGELLISMHQLNSGNLDMIIYYPDVNLENFVYNQYERRVKIIDLEYVIIVERHLVSNLNGDDNHANRRTFHSSNFCSAYMPDFNIEQVCRYILSPSNMESEVEVSSNFLHDIPEKVDREFNLTNVILACAETKSTGERLNLYGQLLDILSKIE